MGALVRRDTVMVFRAPGWEELWLIMSFVISGMTIFIGNWSPAARLGTRGESMRTAETLALEILTGGAD
jgi:hypothetical protein